MSKKLFKKNPVKFCRFYIEYIFVYLMYRLVKILPYSVLIFLGRISGYAMMLLPSIRKPSIANVKIMFPEKSKSECKKIARKGNGSIVLSLLEFVWFSNNQKRIDKYVSLTDEMIELCQLSKKDGESIIFVTPHIGSWEISGISMGAIAGIRFAVVAKNLHNPFLHTLMLKLRTEGTENLVISSDGAVKGMMKALKKDYAMATLIDQNTRVREGGIFIDYCGLSVPCSRAPAMFGRKLNSTISVGVSIRQPDGKHITFAYPLSKAAKDYSSDQELIQELTSISEDIIRKHPEQYLWFYKRFQYIPQEADQELIDKYPYYSTVANPRFYSNKAPK